jgi:molecular chaperone GrpE
MLCTLARPWPFSRTLSPEVLATSTIRGVLVQELKDESTSGEPDDLTKPNEIDPAETPSDEDDTGDVGDTTEEPIAALTKAVAELAGELKAHHARAAARERVIDNLHAEVERLRVGERNLALRPITTDLQHLRTDLLRQAKELPDGTKRGQFAELLESYALTVEQTLERCGIVPLRPEVGAEFSGRQHRAMKAQPTRNADQDGTIAEIRAEGYQDTVTDRVTEPARVVVWRWTPESELDDDAATSEQQEEKSEDG